MGEAAATVGLTYDRRRVVVGDLTEEPDPNLIELCSMHLERLRAPVGWSVLDQRSQEPAARP